MPNQTPTFALPGLMVIARPELERQREIIRLAPKRIQDSSWMGIPSVGPVAPGGAQPTHPLALVRMVFSKSLPVADVSLLELSSASGSIVIDNAVTWMFHVPVQDLPLPVGSYFWELHTEDTEGTNSVYYAGSQLVTA